MKKQNTMEKTFLEKRITQKAEKRFEKEWDEFMKFNFNNSIGKRICIKQKDKDNEDDEINIFAFGCNHALLNGEQNRNKQSEQTNYEEVKKELIEKFIEEETELLLNRMEELKYLMNDRQ